MSMDILNEDTIAAISTAQGPGGIAIIRLSGPYVLNVLKKLFYRKGNKSLDDITPNTFYRGVIAESMASDIIDDVLFVYMKAPKSYTGQDIVEIHCHGGGLIARLILNLCIKNGARAANPGEFTLRAFLNNKMDLSQAEAVADVINSHTERSLKHSHRQLEGQLSKEITEYKDIVIDMLAEIEANVDFPEEGLDPLVRDRILEQADILIGKIDGLLSTFHQGHILKHGISTAIIGKPNVGKSSLLNCLLRKERAIVSEIPGTTRDFIEETIDINGIPLKLIDTAGIRTSEEYIEKLGIELSKKKSGEAEFVIVVLDGSKNIDEDDEEVLELTRNSNYIVILNKNDLYIKTTNNDLPSIIDRKRVVDISVKANSNINVMKERIYDLISGDVKSNDSSSLMISEVRHKNALDEAFESLKRFKSALEKDESPEYLAVDLRYSLDKFGEITGEITSEDILSRVFSKFCIGK